MGELRRRLEPLAVDKVPLAEAPHATAASAARLS
jgi:hypothetical protein